MKLFKILGIVLILGALITLGSGLGERFSVPGIQVLVPDVQARVGRPLTPVSVAGVARRTVRRCAAGVYNCRLPSPKSLDSLVTQL